MDPVRRSTGVGNRNVAEVDYLIIGAGLAGAMVARFLPTDSFVCLDSHPGKYKIGESFLAEFFTHPFLRDLVPLTRGLPSFSEKRGSIFVGQDSAAIFPISDVEASAACHARRDEVEKAMLDFWRIPVTVAKVQDVDLDTKTVTTTAGTWHVRKQIIDCSGPAMVLARRLGLRRLLWSTHAAWIHCDILEVDDRRFPDAMVRSGRACNRYDAFSGDLLETDSDEPLPVSTYTYLTRIADGMWCWQIPLANRTQLSFGITCAHRKVTLQDLHHFLPLVGAPQYALAPRPLDGSSEHNKFHVRNNYAHRAAVASTADAILVGDAVFFGDPIYATGMTYAVNQAALVGEILQQGNWTSETSGMYNRRCEELARNGVDAHYFARPRADQPDAGTVRDERSSLITGSPFQKTFASNYGSILSQTKKRLRPEDEADWFQSPFAVSAAVRSQVTIEAASLLGALASDGHGEWRFQGAWPGVFGVQVVWDHEVLPRLHLLVLPLERVQHWFWKTEGLAVHYRNSINAPFPWNAPAAASFLEAFKAAVDGQRASWRRLVLEWR